MLIESANTAVGSPRVSSRFRSAWIIALLALPTFFFVWVNRDVPHFGVLQDDGLYFGSAKSIAEGT